MARSRIDSDDLPADLEDILEGGDDPQASAVLAGSDEFDANELLSQTFFVDSDDELPLPKQDMLDSQPNQMSSGAGSQLQQMQAFTQRHMFQQQAQTQQAGFSGFDQSFPDGNTNSSQQHQMDSFVNNNSLEDNLALNQQTVNMRVQEVQNKIQQVQEQIQRVQIESNANMMDQSSQGAINQSQNFQVSGMLRARPERNPPGRSVSMPIRRNQMQGNPMNQPTFMMQQPMHALQQQRQQQQQGMMGASMDTSMNSTMSGMNNMNTQQLGNVNSPMNNMDNSLTNMSVTINNMNNNINNNMNGMDNSMNNMNMSMNNNMNAMNNSMNNSMGGNPNNSMGSMQGFGQQGLDNNAMSNSNGFNQGMAMMPQGMNSMSQLTPTPFADGNPAVRQNSLPMASSNNMNMMPAQTGSNMMGTGTFDPSQLQQAFQTTQAQGMLPTSQGQGAGVNEAMEKLCETMRRSAMSRSMVKQLSGRTLTRSSSARGVSRQNSGRLTKQLSGRNLVRANSGRALSRGNSSRSLQRTLEANELPIRRGMQDAKHRMVHNQGTPGRGVFRHKSQSALVGVNNPKKVLNIDGNSVGMF